MKKSFFLNNQRRTSIYSFLLASITKAEFDSALADFNARLTTFEAGINSKIDSQVSSYLDRNGIWNGKEQPLAGKLAVDYDYTVSSFWWTSGGDQLDYWIPNSNNSSGVWPSNNKSRKMYEVKLDTSPAQENETIIDEIVKTGLYVGRLTFIYLIYGDRAGAGYSNKAIGSNVLSFSAANNNSNARSYNKYSNLIVRTGTGIDTGYQYIWVANQYEVMKTWNDTTLEAAYAFRPTQGIALIGSQNGLLYEYYPWDLYKSGADLFQLEHIQMYNASLPKITYNVQFFVSKGENITLQPAKFKCSYVKHGFTSSGALFGMQVIIEQPKIY